MRKWTDLTCCAFINQFQQYRPEFTGFTEEMMSKSSKLQGVINLYYTSLYNDIKLMAAFCVSEKDFAAYQKFMRYISDKLL